MLVTHNCCNGGGFARTSVHHAFAVYVVACGSWYCSGREDVTSQRRCACSHAGVLFAFVHHVVTVSSVTKIFCDTQADQTNSSCRQSECLLNEQAVGLRCSAQVFGLLMHLLTTRVLALQHGRV